MYQRQLYCLFDTPPVRGFLTVNALVAADSGVIVPFVPEIDALMGMQFLLARMEELRPANDGPGRTRPDRRARLDRRVHRRVDGGAG